ncbi:hypothetical protein AX769_17880 [Frondihabitans sp. PAMC 28766]|uniref:hypothetical protein n=1 Tax=Frondihabitans sp. PAMC 28766 TaxID=1795630 RepID=UPI00078BE3AD|nr:hypothetical protein [Frondihabitans sp. PAMC 28766]AMM21674.1 hypothetical protein AX769_17880 [Frondihabitans sp. PAMC 28766]
MKYVYCTSWDRDAWQPRRVLTEDEARARYAGQVPAPDHWFTVAAFRDDVAITDNPEFMVEVLPGAEMANVHFIDMAHNLCFIYGFKSIDGRLFLTESTEYTYAPGGHHPLQEAVAGETATFEVDGSFHVDTWDKRREPLPTDDADGEGLNLAKHWVDIPEFGAWAPLGEYLRLH